MALLGGATAGAACSAAGLTRSPPSPPTNHPRTCDACIKLCLISSLASLLPSQLLDAAKGMVSGCEVASIQCSRLHGSPGCWLSPAAGCRITGLAAGRARVLGVACGPRLH